MDLNEALLTLKRAGREVTERMAKRTNGLRLRGRLRASDRPKAGTAAKQTVSDRQIGS